MDHFQFDALTHELAQLAISQQQLQTQLAAVHTEMVATHEKNRDLADRLNNLEEISLIHLMLIILKSPIIDTIVIDKVVNNILDVIVGIEVMIMSKSETIIARVLSLLLVMINANLKIFS